MLGSYTGGESILALLVALLTLNELLGLVRARLRGRSKNLSRLASHTLMLLLLGPWVGYTFYWVKVMEAPGVTSNTFGSSALNLPYMLLGVGLILIASFEILALYRARREGQTRNISRLVSHTLVVLLVLMMVGLSLLKWSEYVSAEERARSPKAAHRSLGGGTE